MRYRFGPFVADRETYQLREGTRALAITPKLLDLLFHFVERPAALVTKEELLDAIWPDANVTDNALARAVSELRDVLGDSPGTPLYIKTVARRGYRFVATVESAAPHPSPTEPPLPTPASESAAATSTDERAIAVLDFENVTGAPDVGWLAAGIAETVSNDLTALGSIKVIDRWRVVQASRTSAGGLHDVAALLGLPLVVRGSYQRHGPQLRITARVLDVAAGNAVAEAKVDGSLDDVFSLQDEIVATLAREMGLTRGASARPIARETSSLAAYRAHVEGWLTLETLDVRLTPEATAAFERAIDLDPSYAMAYTGLASAKFIAYEMTRTGVEPDFDALGSGVAHAQRAVELDDASAEAHATLAFLLASAHQYEDARSAARRAVALEPDNWRHQFRLGHASWGSARERALERAVQLFPAFPYATLELAMLHTARGDLVAAERAARHGAIEQDRRAQLGARYPSIGFHWFVGILEHAAGLNEAAVRSFDRELALADPHKLYGPEYAAATLIGRGYAKLALGRSAEAIEDFRGSRAWVTDCPRSFIAESTAAAALGRTADAERAAADHTRVTDLVRRTRRPHEALYLEAIQAGLAGDANRIAEHLGALLDLHPPSQLGWTIPVEPAFQSIRLDARFQAVLARVSERAR